MSNYYPGGVINAIIKSRNLQLNAVNSLAVTPAETPTKKETPTEKIIAEDTITETPAELTSAADPAEEDAVKPRGRRRKSE